MPKAAFSTTAFQAATPGMSRLAMALGGGGNTYETAKNNEVLLQSRLAQQLASQNLNDAKAAEIQDELSRGTPEAVRRNVMTGFNIPQAEEREFSGWLDTGKPSGRYALPADDVGPVLPAPEWSKNLAAPARAIMALNNALALGDKNSANVAKATGEFRDQALSDSIINGTANRNTVGGAQAAVAGKPLFHADANGSVLDQFAGNLDTSNPMATATIGLRNAQAKAAGQKTDGLPKPPSGFRNVIGPDGEMRQEPIPGGPKDPNRPASAIPPKPMPTAALKMQNEDLEAIGTASGIQSDLKAFEQQIADGKLNLGVISNLWNQSRNAAGMSTEQSKNLASFKATLERLRNDSLRLNKGVQTDGDAQRAWNELITNINDPGVVTQRLQEIQKLNDRAVQLRQMNIETVRNNFGQPPLDVSGRTNLAPAVGGGDNGGGDGWSIRPKGGQ